MDDTRRRLAYALAIGSLTASTSAVRAQTGPDLLLGPFKENQNVILNSEALFQPTTGTDHDQGDARLSIYNASGRMKLDLDQFASSLNLNRAQPRAGFDFTMIEIDGHDQELPGQFSDTSVGFGMGIAKGEKYKAGISVAVGHASATAFGDGNGWYGKADIAVGVDLSPTETLGVILDYNGNRTFLPDVPLPGIIYTRRIDGDRYKITVGFPYSDITWHPNENWTLMLRYNIPDGGEANVEYKVNEGLRLYASLQQQNDAFHWNQLDNSEDRVFFSQTRAELGVRGTYHDNLSFLLAGGYAFDQSFETGWDTRDTDNITDLDPAPYLRIGLELSF